MFFRWLKCILNCQHFFAESKSGVTLQVYLALIAAVLLSFYTGQKPNCRQMEAMHFYPYIISLDDLQKKRFLILFWEYC
jgi:hypothetical protein